MKISWEEGDYANMLGVWYTVRYSNKFKRWAYLAYRGIVRRCIGKMLYESGIYKYRVTKNISV